MKYEIILTETRTNTFIVEADSAEIARKLIAKKYDDKEIELTEDNAEIYSRIDYNDQNSISNKYVSEAVVDYKAE